MSTTRESNPTVEQDEGSKRPPAGAFARDDADQAGCVVWITGLAGAGKTTLSRAVQAALRAKGRSVVGLDADDLRAALGGDLGYSLEDRRRNAHRVCRVAQMLGAQGNDVVVSTISLFHECHAWNREHNAHYLEVLLEADRALLEARNQKGLFGARSRDVMGVDQAPEMPLAPDLVLEVSDQRPVAELAARVLEKLDA